MVDKESLKALDTMVCDRDMLIIVRWTLPLSRWILRLDKALRRDNLMRGKDCKNHDKRKRKTCGIFRWTETSWQCCNK